MAWDPGLHCFPVFHNGCLVEYGLNIHARHSVWVLFHNSHFSKSVSVFMITSIRLYVMLSHPCSREFILEDFENKYHTIALFLQTVYAIEKLLAGFNKQPRIGMNRSLI